MLLSQFGHTFVHMQPVISTGKLQVSGSDLSASVPEPRSIHMKMRQLRLLFLLHSHSEPTPHLHSQGDS